MSTMTTTDVAVVAIGAVTVALMMWLVNAPSFVDCWHAMPARGVCIRVSAVLADIETTCCACASAGLDTWPSVVRFVDRAHE